MLILGLATYDHGSSVALLNGNSTLVAIEEEKLTRLHDSDDVPRFALIRALGHCGAKLADLKSVALADSSGESYAAQVRRSCSGLPLSNLRDVLNGGPRIRIFDHHLCHAASAFYTSNYDRALVLVLDEGARGRSGLIAVGEGDDIKPVCTLQFANSLGWFYSRVTELLGMRAHRDEHKVQWLSKEGSPDFVPAFRKLFSWNSKGLPVLNRQYLAPGTSCSRNFNSAFYRELGFSGSKIPADSYTYAAVARSAQDVVEELVLELANRFGEETRADSICLAGGVFLNVLLVRALETRSNFRNVYVQPVSGNPGTSLGAGILGRKELTGQSGRAALETLALGPEFTSQQIKAVLDNCKIVYRYLCSDEQLLEETASLLLRGKIVAWYQGRTEFGHRALGNRSILASPFAEYVIENVNHYVKHREGFHPFALSVPAERASEFFDCSHNCRFIASLASLSQSTSGLQRLAFNGNSVRVHTVEKRANPAFWKLLHKFGESAPAPVLVNTSFNLFGEPLVSDPRDAVRSFYCSGIDALAIGSFLVVK
jgi:carbamoyltransferase